MGVVVAIAKAIRSCVLLTFDIKSAGSTVAVAAEGGGAVAAAAGGAAAAAEGGGAVAAAACGLLAPSSRVKRRESNRWALAGCHRR